MKPESNASSAQSRFGGLVPLNRKGPAGMLLVETMISAALLVLVIVSAVTGMLTMNRRAAVNRALTSARVIVERNIETALNVPFDSKSTPSILAITSASGVTWDDDGGGDNKVNILIQNSSGSNSLLKGTLKRIVTAEANPQGADIRRVTFRITFTIRGSNYAAEMTTLRAIDDF